MNIKSKIFIIVNIFISSNLYAADLGLEESIANLWINELDQYEDIVLFKKGHDYYIPCHVLEIRQVIIEKLRKMQNQAEFCLVTDENIVTTFEPSSQSIQLLIPPHFFKANISHLGANNIPEKASFGGFINYDFLYGNSNSNESYSAVMSTGIFKDFWILENGLMYQNTLAEEWVVRLNSSIEFEFPEKMTRLILGDSTTAYNPLINSLRYAGLNWGTNFTERPNFVYWNIPNLQGSARIPSTVELFINGVNIYSQKVSPGDYNIQTGAQIQQAGNAQIVVEDVLGNRSVQSFPILVTNRLLAPELEEYNLAVGKLRYNYNLESDDYRDFFVNGFYRKGLSNSTTLGTNLSYSKDIQNIGLMWTQAISNLFVLDNLILTSNDEEDNFNFSYGLSASKDFGRFSMGISSKYSERNFKFLGDDFVDGFHYPKFENLAYIGLTDVPFFKNVNLNYAEQTYYDGSEFDQPNQKIINFGFNRSFGKRLSFGLSYFNNFGDRKDSGGILSLSYSFDNKAVYFNQSADKNTNLQLVKYDSNQVGFDYSIGVSQRDDEPSYNLNSTLKTNIGNFDIYHFQSKDNRDSQLGFQGAMVWLGNQFNFTKNVNNAFGLVKVGDYPNIDVLRSQTYVDKTNKHGYAFVHDIIPYVKYDIAFDPNQLPIEDKIPAFNKQLTALNQRGYILDFPIFHAQQVRVRPLTTAGERFVAGSELHINNDEGEIYAISSDGTTTLYGLIPAEYKIKIKTKESMSCIAHLNIQDGPANDDIKEIICK